MDFFKDFKELNNYFISNQDHRQITFYAESRNDWPHLSGIIKELLKNTNFSICYISSDKNDQGLKYTDPKFHSFEIKNKHLLSWLFKNIRTKIMIMTLPDLNQFYLKRSKYPVHYIYVPHSLASLHSIYRKGAFDYFDTIFCSGPHHIKEAQTIEKIYKLKQKKLIKFGYGKIDTLIQNNPRINKKTDTIHFLIAPSWGKDCIIENDKIVKIIDNIILKGHRITLRPHPLTIKYSISIIDKILLEYKDTPLFNYAPNTDNDQILYDSDVMISDWSGVAFEYAFALKKPVLFVDTPRKIKNLEYEKIGLKSFEVYARKLVGEFFDLNKNYTLKNINTINEEEIKKNIFSINSSSSVACNYIVNLLKK